MGTMQIKLPINANPVLKAPTPTAHTIKTRHAFYVLSCNILERVKPNAMPVAMVSSMIHLPINVQAVGHRIILPIHWLRVVNVAPVHILLVWRRTAILVPRVKKLTPRKRNV
jgi:hypothetical protein